ncbi:L-ascorbate metabolism protein UlaG (beta-lactamase superfamily) [Paenibacillus cellulosilyticus]|uniref:L-ascorbate metabolism protein UlaG (Beta-lactamase superfamily) n=1 Tax=Paenibacillus cellulosilyticus TaxID=375489 RepID=A0A2V2YQI1_9BACL|nr:MBL fold metallo-hydrolase [Paenibacillus cellulosilyticus]PWV98538.1 L-ascorbate metabolism protein UlaG (beta-lactamase superfamily) [Paenibacillus cellulosilyticus]QKS44144.1 MBL fold metallo-hydrolase [Paenibacillus cellulosilyticus]
MHAFEIIVAILIVLVVITVLFLRYYPPFGARASKEQRQRYGQSAPYNGQKRKFENLIPTSMSMNAKEGVDLLKQYLKGNRNARPRRPLSASAFDLQAIHSGGEQPKVTWFGHSAALLELDGVKLLLDPMLGRAPSPVPVVGGKRYSESMAGIIEALPAIDAIIMSHDHYDHLDYGSIQRLKHKVGQFIVPLGVGNHFERWGIERERIKEFDWWNEYSFNGLSLACTPARHFSGRGLNDRNSTLWCSWVIRGRSASVYFSGDSGYGPHFAQIGEKYGPFDLTLMECGQYNERWAAIHMMPEQTVQAHLDVRGKVLIPIHWAGFTLALHDWTDPVERAVRSAKERDVQVCTPRIGETVAINAGAYPTGAWWRE